MLLLTDPCVRPGALAPDECARLIRYFDAAPDTAAARLAGGVESDIRVCRALWVDDEPETSWIFLRLAALVAKVNREIFHFDLDDFRENLQILRYDAAGGGGGGGDAAGRYDAHTDIGTSGHSTTRKLSLSIQLSEPEFYVGGDLRIDTGDGDWAAPRDAGTAILFPSFVRHSVAALASGTRYALVAWVHGPAFR